MSYQKSPDLRPPGYTGAIIQNGDYHPPLTNPANAPDVATCVEMFTQEMSEREKQLEQLRDQAVHDRELLAAREAQLAAVTIDRDDLQHAHEAIAAQLFLKDSAIARLTATVTSLQASRERAARTHEARAQALQTELSQQTVTTKQVQEHERDHRQNVALLLAHRAGLAGAAEQSRGLPGQVAVKVPALEYLLHTPLAPHAAPSLRRFAAYLHAHLVMAGVQPADLAARGVFEAELAAFVQAERLPSDDQLDFLAACCPSVRTHGPALLAEARADELIERFTPEPLALLPEPVAEPADEVRDLGNKDAGFVSLPALRIVAVVVIAGALTWFCLYVASVLSTGSATLRHERGARPVERASSGLSSAAFTWTGVDMTPQSTTFQLQVNGSVPEATTFTGTLRLEHAPYCSPVVAVQLRTISGTHALALISSRTADMARLAPLRLIGPRLVLMFQRVDHHPCSVELIWEDPGVA